MKLPVFADTWLCSRGEPTKCEGAIIPRIAKLLQNRENGSVPEEEEKRMRTKQLGSQGRLLGRSDTKLN